jgi:hypothetical protein
LILLDQNYPPTQPLYRATSETPQETNYHPIFKEIFAAEELLWQAEDYGPLSLSEATVSRILRYKDGSAH